MSQSTLQHGGRFEEYNVDVEQGMIALDCIQQIQTHQANDLVFRWNYKVGKCGSCSMEINGKHRLSCMMRMNTFAPDEITTVQPFKTFLLIKDLVTDVSWNYE